MRLVRLLFSIPLLAQAIGSSNTLPFFSSPLDRSDLVHKASELVRRQITCPAGYNSCAAQGNREACCQPGTFCTHDAANHIACCPSGATCTGVLSGTGTPGPTGTGFMFPQPGPTTTTSPTVTGSTVPGAPFPFTYISTTFPNQAACSAAYSGCVQQFSSCTSVLGGINGVTVSGGGGFGTTVAGVAPTGNPQSICSSLSAQACYGLQAGYCTAFGTGRPTNSAVVNFGGTPVRRSVGGIYEIVVGLTIAIAGMIT